MELIQTLIAENYFLFTLYLFVCGACVGSFLNVCIYRMPEEGKSIVKPRSSCPSCSAPIAWYDNIPILSYIILRGKCRSCGVQISPQYIFVEALTGYLFVEFFILFGFSIYYVAYLYLTCSLLIATMVDFKLQIIPDEVNYAGIVAGCVLSFFFPEIHGAQSKVWGLLYALLGLIVGGGVIYGTGILGNLVFRKESMGGGDVKLMAMIGCFLGWKMILLTFFIAPFLGSGVGLYVKFVKKQEIIPYGPFLSFSALIALFAGDKIIAFVLGG